LATDDARKIVLHLYKHLHVFLEFQSREKFNKCWFTIHNPSNFHFLVETILAGISGAINAVRGTFTGKFNGFGF
jgi:hypothetical protein